MKEDCGKKIKGAEQRFAGYHLPGAKTVVVFVHGIVEGPALFQPLVQETIKRGYSAVNLLLPGHGSDGRAFAQSGMRQWQDYVDGAVRHLRRRYPHLVLVGHSMGGLLALECVRKMENGADGVFALNLPLWLRVKGKGILEGYKASSGRIEPEDESARAALAAYSVRDVRPLCYLRWLPRYRELFRLCRSTRRQLEKFFMPVCVVQSLEDEFVDYRTAERLKWIRPDWQVEMLENSGHFYYSPKDFCRIKTYLFTFIEMVINTKQKNQF